MNPKMSKNIFQYNIQYSNSKQGKWLFILLILLIIGCTITACTTTEKETHLNFNKNKEFSYKTGTDTLCLQVSDVFWKLDTTQYKISWFLKNANNDGQTGIFVNKSRIWLHPPRFDVYKILEFCPFPEIRTPLKIGTKWSDSLVIGDHYSDSRFVFEGLITFYHNYEIIGQKKIKTNFGELNCWEVVANGTSRTSKTATKIAKSTTKIYYNKDFGFVKMIFGCVDNTEISLNLIAIKPFQIVVPFDFLPKSMK